MSVTAVDHLSFGLVSVLMTGTVMDKFNAVGVLPSSLCATALGVSFVTDITHAMTELMELLRESLICIVINALVSKANTPNY